MRFFCTYTFTLLVNSEIIKTIQQAAQISFVKSHLMDKLTDNLFTLCIFHLILNNTNSIIVTLPCRTLRSSYRRHLLAESLYLVSLPDLYAFLALFSVC